MAGPAPVYASRGDGRTYTAADRRRSGKTSIPGGLTNGHLKLHPNLHQLATEGAFNAEGWFMTGDLGRLDEAGYLRVTGRKKDVINRGGRKIYPARIEELALRHAGMEKAGGVSGCRLASGGTGLS